MSANDICRVSADIRAHLEKQAQNEQFADVRLDPWNDALMRDLFGRLAPSLQDLFVKLEQVEKTNASFGADKEKSFDFILPSLQRLREACEEECRQL